MMIQPQFHMLVILASSPCLTPTTDNAVNAFTLLCLQILQYFHSSQNIFRLCRKYYGLKHPSHDPEDHLTLQDLCEANTNTTPLPSHCLSSDHPFYPYPNQSSFSLGDWYWNQGLQKTQESFRKLIEIVGCPKYKPDDVWLTNWAKINAILAHNAEDSGDQNDHEWLDEDTGCKHTAICISVPFHSHMAVPGLQNYLAGELYHRSLYLSFGNTTQMMISISTMNSMNFCGNATKMLKRSEFMVSCTHYLLSCQSIRNS